MFSASEPFWFSASRVSVPYAERSDERESAIERTLLAAGSRLTRGFNVRRRQAQHVARLVEQNQAKADALSDSALRACADDLRMTLRQTGFAPELVAQAFALIRCAAERTRGMKHFPVQLMGGYCMLNGALVEMQTGEGKTLTATLPAAVVALTGRPVHIVTVNDYLAQRDAELMGPLYAALGITVGVAYAGQETPERCAAYAADIAYCANKELGFDYLRDRIALPGKQSRTHVLLDQLYGNRKASEPVRLRGLYFAIVDEADSVLIDEAKTPLIIAGAAQSESDQQLYATALDIARTLVPHADFRHEVRERSVTLTVKGKERLARMSGQLPGGWASARGREEIVQQALSALLLHQRDIHYVLRDGKVQIVDENTGRVYQDRTWERGLHQLVEAKEEVELTGRHTTLARITYQRLFRRFLRLAGMSGTVWEVSPELDAVYGLKVARIPTNRPLRRMDAGTRLYPDAASKWQAVVDAVVGHQRQGRPVLVGTRSVMASERLAAMLSERGIGHVVLNARQDKDEAAIVEHAGQPGRVTVATDMAGRGTDIQLGPGMADKGGLHVILTEFHESARIDRQLYGRCGRQGDPGSHEAVVSLDDEIFVHYAPSLVSMLKKRVWRGGQPENSASAKLLRTVAQRAAERAHAAMRAQTLESDRKLDTDLALSGHSE